MDIEGIRASKEPYLIFRYNIDNLKKIFQACSKITIEKLDWKLQKIYFETYFDEIKTKTIVLEKKYIDKDYLEDFSNYYIRCFNSYERFCGRIHFFDTEYDNAYFKSIITGTIPNLNEELEKLNKSYLGFIVLKNLPQTIIGRTCLKTYETVYTDRHYPVIRNYDVNLFGIPLKIKTLAFQEQDSVAAACASSALWSMFHGTGALFQHTIPSPYVITKLATENFPTRSRIFPNKGLSLEMMAKAIRDLGLEPLFVSTKNIIIAKATIYAYLKAGIPLLLGEMLYKKETLIEEGLHAVAIVGYHLNEKNTAAPYSRNGLLLKASKLDKIYAHDDQVGPFARMNFLQNISKLENWGMSTSFGMENGQEMYMSNPEALLIPTYHKIRIPFIKILEEINKFDRLLENFIIKYPNLRTFVPKIEWDIYLTTSNDLRKEIRESQNLVDEYKYEICTKNYPKYLWNATGYINNKKVITMLFDATDIEQNEFLFDIISYDETIYNTLATISVIIYEEQKPKPVDNVIISHFSGYNYVNFIQNINI